MRLILCLIAILLASSASTQRTTRQHLKIKPVQADTPTVCMDTVYCSETDSACIVFSGFEKVLKSRKESFFATNTGLRDIVGLKANISYTDMKDRQLHAEDIELECSIPAGETRLLTIPAWDTQGVWYYYLSQKPSTRSQATPFKAQMSLIYIVHPQ